jgi:hypothetical protein
MATARHHYADLSLVCQSSLSIMSERNWSRNIMRQKNNVVFLQISSQVSTKRSSRRVLKPLGRASRPQNDDLFLLQHRIDLGFAGGDGVTSAGSSNAALLRRGADWIFCSAPSLASNQLSTGLATVAAARSRAAVFPRNTASSSSARATSLLTVNARLARTCHPSPQSGLVMPIVSLSLVTRKASACGLAIDASNVDSCLLCTKDDPR